MEFFIFVADLVLGLDRLFQKSLGKAIPNLGDLLDSPREVLARQSVLIGPARRYASGVFVGLLIAVVLEILNCSVVLTIFERRDRPLPRFLLGVLPALALVSLLLGIWLGVKVVRGGRLLLRADGVEMTYRRWRLFCPWLLFNAPGQPFRPGRDRFLLPINPAAVSEVVLHKGDVEVARGKAIRSRLLKFKSQQNQAVFGALYEVPAEEVGTFLLLLGRLMGTNLPEASVSAPPAEDRLQEQEARAPASGETRERAEKTKRPAGAWLDAGSGGVTVQLTRVVLPPFCCACGERTTNQVEFRSPSRRIGIPLLWEIGWGEVLRVWAPLCPSCEAKDWRSYWKFPLLGVVTGAVLFPLLFVWAPAWVNQHPWTLDQVQTVAVLGAVVGGVLGHRGGLCRRRPVRVDNYAPAKGMATFWFHHPEYARLVWEMVSEAEQTADRAS